MDLLIIDSTPLIHLGKADILEKISELEYNVIVPLSVFEEVVNNGKRRGLADALKIERIIRSEPFEVVDVKKGEIHDLFKENRSLSDADKDVLEAARRDNGIAILDESYGRSICEVEGIKHKGSLWILKELIIHRAITPEQARNALDMMIEGGWYCSTVLYSRALRMIDGFI